METSSEIEAFSAKSDGEDGGNPSFSSLGISVDVI
jgi:hypothetical protein